MKTHLCLWGYFLALLFHPILLPDASARVWTSLRGSTVDAEMVRMEGDMVILRKPDGNQMRIRIADLIPEDQAFIRNPTGVAVKTPSNRSSSRQALPVTPGNAMSIHGVELKPGQRTNFECDIPSDLQGDASKNGNPTPLKAKAVMALPLGFDPLKNNPVLIVNATSDGDASSVGHLGEYWETGIECGWVVIAADPVEKPKEDNNAWRWALISSTLQSMHSIWPQSKSWPVATAGFSGGAKRAGYMGALLVKNDYALIGMFMGGCNQDMASKGLDEFKPKKSDFLRVPIFLSNGKSDTVASVESGERTGKSMDKSGFKSIKLETYDGGHNLYRPHVKAALDWFMSESAK